MNSSIDGPARASHSMARKTRRRAYTSIMTRSPGTVGGWQFDGRSAVTSGPSPTL